MEASASTATKEAWIRGLALNSGAPPSVQTRILSLDQQPHGGEWLRGRSLPREVALAAAHHLDPLIKKIILENRSLPSEVFALLAQDPDPGVRRVCIRLAAEYGVDLPRPVLEVLAADPSPRTRYAVGRYPGLPMDLRRRLLDDPEPEARAGALNRQLWDELTPERRESLAGEEHQWIRSRVEQLSRQGQALPCSLQGYLAEPDNRRRRAAAKTAHVDGELAEYLIRSETAWERYAAAGNPNIPATAAMRLSDDPDQRVRLSLSLREDIDE